MRVVQVGKPRKGQGGEKFFASLEGLQERRKSDLRLTLTAVGWSGVNPRD